MPNLEKNNAADKSSIVPGRVQRPAAPLNSVLREFLNNCLLALCLVAVLVAGVFEKLGRRLGFFLLVLGIAAVVILWRHYHGHP